MTLAIIDYGSGNLRSVAKAFERVAGDHRAVVVTSLPEDIASASHIVLPGVGAFADCMSGLKALPGMLDMLQEQVHQRKKPFLGICVGMQMLFECGLEHGVHDGLGWLKGEVVGLLAQPDVGCQMLDVKVDFSLTSDIQHPTSGAQRHKIPHMGWNNLSIRGDHPLMKGIHEGDHAYFVHSYHALCRDDTDVIATVSYGQTVTAVVARGNIMGTQFHPEKSQETGLKLLSNFLELT